MSDLVRSEVEAALEGVCSNRWTRPSLDGRAVTVMFCGHPEDWHDAVPIEGPKVQGLCSDLKCGCGRFVPDWPARVWLSTPTEPTDEPKRYYLCQHEDYESRKDCERYGLDPVWDKGLNCRWVLIIEGPETCHSNSEGSPE